MKIIICTPTRDRPHDAYLDALEKSIPALDAAGIGHSTVYEVGNPYISYAEAQMLHKALATDADAFVFIEDDESWRPQDLVKLIETDGDVVAGTYRFKLPKEEYMGSWHCDASNRPIQRLKDGAIRASMVPAGFLKITREGVRKFMRGYPELVFGYPERPAVDLFNHGAHVGGNDGKWWGQDYAFCKRWSDMSGDIWLVPDLSIDHHDRSGNVWPGNLHQYLLRLPGGSEHIRAVA